MKFIYGCHIWWEWVRRNVSPNETILDIGCGEGMWWRGYGYKGRHNIRDPNAPEYENLVCIDLDIYNHRNFIQADAHFLPFRDDSFDVVVLSEVLEHVINPEQVVKEALRVAFRIIFTTPVKFNPITEEHFLRNPWLEGVLLGYIPDLVVPHHAHLRVLTPKQLEELFSPHKLVLYKTKSLEGIESWCGIVRKSVSRDYIKLYEKLRRK